MGKKGVLLGLILAGFLLLASWDYLMTRTEQVISPQSKANQSTSKTTEDPYLILREEMVRTQIEARGVSNEAVLSAMRTVPRHEFVPKSEAPHAYEDRPLPIGYGQTISQPYVVAAMTAALDLNTTSRVLEIGTGSGYQAAVLSRICSEVYSVEIVKPLAQTAADTLRRLGFYNVHVKCADGYYGWKEHAPYDGIIVTCATSHIPPPLISQLADGGRLVLPLGSPYTWQTLTVVEKRGNATQVRYLFPVMFVPMTGTIQDQKVNSPP